MVGNLSTQVERRKVSLAEEIMPLKWYPSVYLLVSIFPLINRASSTERWLRSNTAHPLLPPSPGSPSPLALSSSATSPSIHPIPSPHASCSPAVG
ncbi:G-protein coupled receptor 157 isoform X2 [Lates japonicus]|uniref:G-protein coupled receptor 157 isoform X2 n=1 Tax=Lates japonicus TaxID=270547 RepID=A0AAD3NGM5_LATJO|nr:G-protein coupled receptor 157 isoform X2 [Lates japonicus]